MKKNRISSVLGTICLALAGCQSNERTVRFGDYTMSAQTYDYIIDATEEESPMHFSGIVYGCKKSDTDRNKHISLDEAKDRITESLDFIENR